MKTFNVLTFLILINVSGLSTAQTRCPPGAAPGSVVCQPDIPTQSTPQTVIRYTGYWIKTWGALADGKNGIGGATVGRDSKAEAEGDAMSRCVARGGVDCAVTISYHDQCVAATNPVNPVGNSVGRFVTAGSLSEAKRLALESCNKFNGGAACEVVYSSCTERKYIKY